MKREEAIKSIKLFFEGLRVALSNETKEAFNTLIPELAESKDERIRKFLINILSHGTWRKEWPFGPNEVVAYLEKQKEQKSTVEKLREISTPADENWFEIQKKWENEDEQKPAELSDEELQRHQDELYNFKVFAAKQAKEYHISFVHDFEWNNFCAELLSYFNEKPAEWSEEDEIRLKEALEVLDESIKYLPMGYGFPKDAMCVKDWLKSLHPQQKQEWSDEDKLTIADLINYFEGDSLECSTEEMVQRIKSLRPSWKPSEQEKSALRTAIYVLTDERSFPKTAAQLQNILDAFNGKESRKDWKPSEEQMRAVFDASERNDKLGSVLRNLYDDLKKLI